jgi:hypothetical protein
LIEKQENHNPFFLRLEPDKKGAPGVASAFLEFRPNCEKCGKDLDDIKHIIKPVVKGEVPNFHCPDCNLDTEYKFLDVMDALDDFRDRYPPKKMYEMGYHKLNINRDALNYKGENDRTYIQ